MKTALKIIYVVSIGVIVYAGFMSISKIKEPTHALMAACLISLLAATKIFKL